MSVGSRWLTSGRPLLRSAEVALLLVTLGTVVGMQRLFDGGGWAGPLVLNASTAHVVAALLRRRNVPLGLAAIAMALCATLVATWTSYWSTTALGIPTGDTWAAMQDDLGAAWDLYQDVVAPAPVATGFVLASSLAVWVIAYVADWAAFRLWVPFEATLPAGTLFLFTALLGEDRGRSWAVALYAGTLLGFLLVHRVARQEGTTHWVAERRLAGRRSLLTIGTALGTVAVVVGVVLGPAIPGADAEGVLDPRDINDQDDARVTVSPLVDIRSRLVDQAAVEVFQVRSTDRAYWRLTSLERFDGRIWSSSGSYGRASGDLPESYENRAGHQVIEQSYAIEALAAIWLPSAFQPQAYEGEGAEVRYDEESSTLIVDSSVPTSDGLTYAVTSASPRLVPEDLTGTIDEVPDDVRERFTTLPDDFSPRVRDLAVEITAGARTPYDAALALQNHLRSFDYDLGVQSGHGTDALEAFLFETQAGYCEQFAGSFAAMARAVGLPSRVAVGFTPGDADPNEAGLFRVRGEHAHAWPEVFFAEVGWVAFEPTPGRGMPAAEPYTGVPEAQATSGRPNESTTVTEPAQPAPSDDPGAAPTTIPPLEVGGGATGDEGDDGGDGDESLVERIVLGPARTLLPILLGLVLLYLVAVPAALHLHRTRRRRRATTARARIHLAWVETVEEAGLLGFTERLSDTYDERAARLAELLPVVDEDVVLLARALEAAEYSAEGADDDIARLAEGAATSVAAAARQAASPTVRARRWLDPRPSMRSWRRARRATHRRITTVVADPEPREAVDALVD